MKYIQYFCTVILRYIDRWYHILGLFLCFPLSQYRVQQRNVTEGDYGDNTKW